MPPDLRRLNLEQMEEAARVLRRSFDARLPWLAGLHTPEQDRFFFREILYPACEIWGAFDEGTAGAAEMAGIIAFKPGWVEQLYVLPDRQGRGLGRALLDLAKAENAELQLWTFQKNQGARRFYESQGFRIVEESDGRRNEEREPDLRYLWRKAA